MAKLYFVQGRYPLQYTQSAYTAGDNAPAQKQGQAMQD